MPLGPGAVDLSTQGTVRVATSVATIVSQLNASAAGDTVQIAAGSYGYVTTTRSIATGFIRIVPAPGATVTIAGVDMSGAQGLDWRGINTTGNSSDNVWWQGSSRCRWRGGTHTIAATANCFTVRQSTSDIIVEDVTVNGALCSFYVQAFDEATRPTNITFSRFRSTSVAQDHVFLSRGDTIVVEDFEMFGHTESAEHQDGVQIVGPKSVTIRRGHIWNPRAFRNSASDQNDHGIIANYDPAETPNGRVPENITVENVLIHDMTSHGITVAGVLSMTIRNCTIYDNGPTGTASALSVAPDPGNTISGLVITNNILSKVAVSGVTPTTNSHNFVGDGSGPAGTSLLSGAPGFVDATTQDYALTEASQNLVSGSATYAPTTDMNGATRPSPPSRGALEATVVGGGGTSGPPVIRSVSALGAQTNWPNLILTKPAGVVEGDELVAIQIVTGGGAGTPASVTAPAGFVQTGATHQITDAGIGKVWRKRAGSSEPTTYTFGGDNRDGLAVIMLAVEAGTFDPDASLDVTPLWGGAALTATAQPAPTATTTADNTLLVCAWASRTFNNAASYTPPAGMTEIADTNPAWNYITAAAATELRTDAGATGTRTATCTRASNYLSVTLALAPAVAAAAPVTGALASTSPGPVGAVAGTVRATGAVAAATPVPVAAAVGTVRATGELAAAAPTPTASGAAAVRAAAAVAGSTPSPAATATASVTATGSVTGDLPAPSMTAQGTVAAPGAVTATAPHPTAALAATHTATGALAAAAPIPVGALAGTGAATGAVAATLPGPTATIATAMSAPAVVDGLLPVPAAAGAATVTASGVVNAAAPAPEASGTGSVTTAGSVAATVPSPVAALAGTVTADGVVAAELPAPTGGVTGTIRTGAALAATLPTPGGGSLAGTVATTGGVDTTTPVPGAALGGSVDSGGGLLSAALPAPTASLAADLAVPGLVAGGLPLPQASIGGDTEAVVAALAAGLPNPEASVVADVTVAGELATALPAPAAVLAGTSPIVGGVAGRLPQAAAALAGAATLTAVVDGVLPAPAAALTEDVPLTGWPPAVSGPFTAALADTTSGAEEPLIAASAPGSSAPLVAVSTPGAAPLVSVSRP